MSSKEALKTIFAKDPDRYYRVKLFNELGFERRKCKNCEKNFWTLDPERTTCPDPPCEQYGFIGNPPSKRKFDYIETWQAVEKFFVDNDHTSVPSYPTVCRWFPGLYFTIASIIAFQRSIGGKTVFEFPYNKIIIPQVCLRFPDITNVGVSGRHHTSFVMVGQHCYADSGYWKDTCIELDFRLLTDIFKIKPKEISFVEDVWLGPNAFGYSLEYFVRGLELGNAVFTEFLGTPDNYRQMDRKIIDMGAGLERFCWLLNGTPTSYDAVFGPVIRELKKKIDYDQDLFLKFSKLAGELNLDEVPNLERAKRNVAEKMLGISYEEFKKKIDPLTALYAIADHTKTLLYAIMDGQLPSNVGGGYNLRVILRRALGFINEFDFDFKLFDVCEAHANYLKKLDPRITSNLDDVAEILDVETRRFEETRKRTNRIVESLIEKNVELGVDKLTELYESHGITPELIEDVAKRKDVNILIPSNFYSKLSEGHIIEKEEQKEFSLDVKTFPPTIKLYYDEVKDFTATVLGIVDGKYVILDRTAFYPRSGGQEPDFGTLGGHKVYDTEKLGNVIIHFVENPKFKIGEEVHGLIDWQRRTQLMQHHTGTHILNGAAKEVLGKHVWQHSAFKDYDYARIDITHYEIPSEEQIEKIEKLANETVKKAIKMTKDYIPRIDAESKHGFTIYQGGAAPEKELRIVNITGFDVEACGGTHANNTADVGEIIIKKVERVQDGIIRFVFTAGLAAKREKERLRAITEECSRILDVDKTQLVEESAKLFDRWKSLRKDLEKKAEKEAESLSEELKKKFVNNILIENLDVGLNELRAISKDLSSDNNMLVLFSDDTTIVSIGKNFGKDVNAGIIVREICEKLGGKGGGSPYLGQGLIKDKSELQNLIRELKKKWQVK